MDPVEISRSPGPRSVIWTPESYGWLPLSKGSGLDVGGLRQKSLICYWKILRIFYLMMFFFPTRDLHILTITTGSQFLQTNKTCPVCSYACHFFQAKIIVDLQSWIHKHGWSCLYLNLQSSLNNQLFLPKMVVFTEVVPFFPHNQTPRTHLRLQKVFSRKLRMEPLTIFGAVFGSLLSKNRGIRKKKWDVHGGNMWRGEILLSHLWFFVKVNFSFSGKQQVDFVLFGFAYTSFRFFWLNMFFLFCWGFLKCRLFREAWK